jgi:diguanylate cyclase (GGDEF)-like protein/PAS domain S-box-containing protein
VGGSRLLLASARDVTERRRMEEALRASEASLARVQQVARLGSWEAKMPTEGTPPGESTMLWSDEMYRIFGYGPQSFELTYRGFLRLVHPEDRGEIKRKIRRAVYDRSDDIEYRRIRPNGEERYVQGRYELGYDRKARSVYMVGALQDITERKALEEKLSYQAFHDALTGLPNRSLLQVRLEQALASRHRGELALLFVDLDNFKDVNDTLGHEAGDEMLVRVGERLQACLSLQDTVARFGGDEFIVLFEDLEGLEDARAAAERITASLRAPFSAAGREILLTTSIGIVGSGPDRESPGELLRDADVALYQAKAEGRA